MDGSGHQPKMLQGVLNSSDFLQCSSGDSGNLLLPVLDIANHSHEKTLNALSPMLF